MLTFTTVINLEGYKSTEEFSKMLRDVIDSYTGYKRDYRKTGYVVTKDDMIEFLPKLISNNATKTFGQDSELRVKFKNILTEKRIKVIEEFLGSRGSGWL